MSAILDAILMIGNFFSAIFDYFMYSITGLIQIVDTAFTVIKGIPHYMVFLPAGGVALITSAIGIILARTMFGR